MVEETGLTRIICFRTNCKNNFNANTTRGVCNLRHISLTKEGCMDFSSNEDKNEF